MYKSITCIHGPRKVISAIYLFTVLASFCEFLSIGTVLELKSLRNCGLSQTKCQEASKWCISNRIVTLRSSIVKYFLVLKLTISNTPPSTIEGTWRLGHESSCNFWKSVRYYSYVSQCKPVKLFVAMLEFDVVAWQFFPSSQFYRK